MAVENAWTAEARAVAEIRQQTIEKRTAQIRQGVNSLHDRLAAMQSNQDDPDITAFEQQAQLLLDEMAQLSPLLAQASQDNAHQLATLRQKALARDGLTALPALQLPRDSSITICHDVLLGLRPGPYANRADLIMTSKGESVANRSVRLGESISMTSGGTKVVATVTAFDLGPDGDLIGINFDCLDA